VRPLDPAHIRYTSDSISATFQGGGTLCGTIEDLRSGKLKSKDFPRICVFWDDDEQEWFSIHNRRLHCFKEAQLPRISVREIDRSSVDLSKVTTTTNGYSVRVRNFEPRRDSNFSSTASDGCWILTHQAGFNEMWTLYYADASGEYNTGISLPSDSKFVTDGKGGVWALCGTTGVTGQWGLWHCDANEERQYYEYPSESSLYSDGEGGVWVLCNGENGRGELWHATTWGEDMRYLYPLESQIAPDGKGGVWVLCSTDGEQRLWHASKHDGECNTGYHYPEDSLLVGDGSGGVWILCRTHGDWKLWHANHSREREFYDYPSDSKMVGDGEGGVFVLCRTNGKHALWHANQASEWQCGDGTGDDSGQFPADTKLVSDHNGGAWLLCSTADVDQWVVWRLRNDSEYSTGFKYPSTSRLVDVVAL